MILARLIDVVLLTVSLVLLTGGYVFRTADGKPIAELSDLAPFGVLLITITLVAIRQKISFKDIAGRSYVLSKLMRLQSYRFVGWGILFFATLFCFVTVICMHYSLRTGFDTAIFDQALYNTSQGNFLFSQIKSDQSLLADHVQPILLFFVPLYLVCATPLWLFAAQACSLAVAGAAFIKLCRFEKLSEKWIILLLVVLVSHRAYRGVLINDFHPIAFAVPVFLFLFYFMRSQKLWWAIASSLALLMCKEYMGIYLVFVGIYAFITFSDKTWRFGFSLYCLIIGIVHYYWVNSLLMPYFGQETSYLYRYAHLGNNMLEIVSSALNPLVSLPLIFQAAKLHYILYLFGPLLFIPCLALPELILLLPFLGQNMLSNNELQYVVGGSHYAAEGVAILFFALVRGLGRIQCGELISRSSFAVIRPYLPWLFVCAVIVFHGRPDILMLRKSFLSLDRYAVVEAAQQVIKPDSRLAAQHVFLPHFTSRQPTYLYPTDRDVDVMLVSAAFKPWPLQAKNFVERVERDRSTAAKVVALENKTFVFFK